MNKNTIILILSIAVAVLAYFAFYEEEVIVEPVDVVVPGFEGTEEEVIEDVIEETVSTTDPETLIITEYVVDKEYKEKYEQAVAEKDSAQARLLYLEAIQIKEYNEVVIDNDSIKIDLYAKTRGSLVAYKVDYNVKERTFTYTPEVINVRPKLTLLTGVELGVSPLGLDPTVKFDAYLQNRKGHMFGGGIDTQGNYFVGYKHAISFKKLNPFSKSK